MANIIATIWSKKAKKVQQKPVYALHALLNYQTIPILYVAIRVITHHGSCVNLSAENISFLGSSDNLFWKCNSCITIKVTPFKTLEAKIDSVLFKLEEPRTEIQPAQPSKPIEVLQNNKYDHHYRVGISGISKSKKNHLLIDNLLIKKKWKKSSKN